MRFSGLIALLGLLLIQSQTAHCTFVCNDNGRLPTAKTGYCVRPFPLDKRNVFLAVAATTVDSSKFKYTCDGVVVFNGFAKSRFCCNITPRHKGSFAYFEKSDLDNTCYGRDGKEDKKKKN